MYLSYSEREDFSVGLLSHSTSSGKVNCDNHSLKTSLDLQYSSADHRPDKSWNNPGPFFSMDV